MRVPGGARGAFLGCIILFVIAALVRPTEGHREFHLDNNVEKDEWRLSLDPEGRVTSPGFPVPSCDKIALFKTHKTGSTTLQVALGRVASIQRLRVQPSKSGWKNHYLNIGGALSEDVPRERLGDVSLRHARNYTSVAHLEAGWAHLLGTHRFSIIAPVREASSLWFSAKSYFRPAFTFVKYVDGCRARGELGTKVPNDAEDNWGTCWNPLARGDFRLYEAQEVEAFAASDMFARMFFIPTEHMQLGMLALARACGWPPSHTLTLRANKRRVKPKAWLNPRFAAEIVAHDEHQRGALVAKVSEFTALDAALYDRAKAKFLADIEMMGGADLYREAERLEAIALEIARDCAALRSCMQRRPNGDGCARFGPYASHPAAEAAAMCDAIAGGEGLSDVALESSVNWTHTENFVPLRMNVGLYEEYFDGLDTIVP